LIEHFIVQCHAICSRLSATDERQKDAGRCGLPSIPTRGIYFCRM